MPVLMGREIADSGVPGGTLTVNDRWPPPTRVTVITHWSAEAVGNAATPSRASADAAVTAPMTSFRLLSTVVCLLPRSAGAYRRRRDHGAARAGRYWVTPSFATVKCFCP